MELTEEVKALVLNTAKELKGSTRRMFMVQTVQALGEGGQRRLGKGINLWSNWCHNVSDRHQTDEGGDEGRGNPTSTTALSGKMVCGRSVDSLPGSRDSW